MIFRSEPEVAGTRAVCGDDRCVRFATVINKFTVKIRARQTTNAKVTDHLSELCPTKGCPYNDKDNGLFFLSLSISFPRVSLSFSS